jgi:Reverse transcriptase (RNA-dependent DNA polymerase)
VRTKELDGVAIEQDEGAPQGGPLSLLMANVLLDEVDKELERRGHALVGYADDLNVYSDPTLGRAGDDLAAQAARNRTVAQPQTWSFTSRREHKRFGEAIFPDKSIFGKSDAQKTTLWWIVTLTFERPCVRIMIRGRDIADVIEAGVWRIP